MYPPKHHQEYDFNKAKLTFKNYPLATLITSDQEQLAVTHLPLIHYDNGTEYGELVGHMDKFNPQVKLLEQKTHLVIFHGPDSYISPTVYASDQLPTWNYVKIHLSGRSSMIKRDDELISTLVKMADFLEEDGSSYQLKKDDDKMKKILNMIVGFRIQIHSWEGKFKLSQDKTEQDKQLAKTQLSNHAQKDIVDYLNNIIQ